MKGDLTELIARVEAATGPDRELDHALHRLEMGEWMDAHGYARDGDGYLTQTPPIQGGARCCGPGYFTESVDAAIALAERMKPGCTWQLFRKSDGTAFAVIELRHRAGGFTDRCDAATPALALILALLRALEAKRHD